MDPNGMDVMAVSDMCVDIILRGNVRPEFGQVEQIVDDCSIQIGGSANIFMTQMAKLGARTGLLGWMGNDAFADFLLRTFHAIGVDTTHLKTHPTLKTGVGLALTEPDDRSILAYMGTIDATSPEDLSTRLLEQCRHWHVACYFLLSKLRQCWPEWLRQCKMRGMTTSLDTNWDPEKRWEGVIELLPNIDVFLPNEAEALAISREATVPAAARMLASKGPLVVVKCGADGALAVKGSETWEFHPGPEDRLAFVADATGAGDNFDAGFLRAWLLGYEIDACMRLGHACALSSLGYLGGIEGQLVRMIAPPEKPRGAAGVR